MINHFTKYIGKKFLYVLPVKPYPYIKIEYYIICEVIIKKIFNKYSCCEITKVIYEHSDYKIYSYNKDNNILINCSNIFLYNF